MRLDTLTLEIHNATLTDGGSTTLADGTAPTTGYGVGGLVPSMIVAREAFTPDDVSSFAAATVPVWDASQALGTWLDEDTDLVHLDRTAVVSDRGEALALAAARGEIAVWCFASGTEIRL